MLMASSALQAYGLEQGSRGRVGMDTCQTRAAGALAWISKRASHALLRPLDNAAARHAEEEPVTPAFVAALINSPEFHPHSCC